MVVMGIFALACLNFCLPLLAVLAGERSSGTLAAPERSEPEGNVPRCYRGPRVAALWVSNHGVFLFRLDGPATKLSIPGRLTEERLATPFHPC